MPVLRVPQEIDKLLLTGRWCFPNWLEMSRCWLSVTPNRVGGGYQVLEGAGGAAGPRRCQTQRFISSDLQRRPLQAWQHTCVND